MSDLILGKPASGGDFVVAMDDDGDIFFPGYEFELDLAAVELGFEDTKATSLFNAYSKFPLLIALSFYIGRFDKDTLVRGVVEWMKDSTLINMTDEEVLQIKEGQVIRQWARRFLLIGENVVAGVYNAPGSLRHAQEESDKLTVSLATADDGTLWLYNEMVAFTLMLELINMSGEVVHDEPMDTISDIDISLFDVDSELGGIDFARAAQKIRVREMVDIIESRKK